MSVIRNSELAFRDLPGRASADPFHSIDPGELAVRVAIVEEGTARTPHRHPRSPEVVFVAEGQGVSWQEGTVARVSAGDLIWIPQNAAHATIPDPGSRLKLICFFPHKDLGSNLIELEETIEEKG